MICAECETNETASDDFLCVACRLKDRHKSLLCLIGIHGPDYWDNRDNFTCLKCGRQKAA